MGCAYNHTHSLFRKRKRRGATLLVGVSTSPLSLFCAVLSQCSEQGCIRTSFQDTHLRRRVFGISLLRQDDPQDKSRQTT